MPDKLYQYLDRHPQVAAVWVNEKFEFVTGPSAGYTKMSRDEAEELVLNAIWGSRGLSGNSVQEPETVPESIIDTTPAAGEHEQPAVPAPEVKEYSESEGGLPFYDDPNALTPEELAEANNASAEQTVVSPVTKPRTATNKK